MKNFDYKMLNDFSKRWKIDSYELFETIEHNLKYSLIESGGISREVVWEVKRLKKVILDKLKNATHRIIGNGIGQEKVSFDENVFGTKYHFNISLINYRTRELWANEENKYRSQTGAEIDVNKHLLYLNIESINGQILSETFDNSLQHELQHYYDINKSEYSWATEDTYSLALKLMDGEYDNIIEDDDIKNILYMIGVLLYASFKGEQSGYTNGLYASLKQKNVPKTRVDVDNASRNDDTYKILLYIRLLSSILNREDISDKVTKAIDYVNNHTTKKYTKEKLSNMCLKVEHEFYKRVNRAKGEYISPNGVYEIVLPKITIK